MEFFFTVVHEKNSAKKRKLDLRTGAVLRTEESKSKRKKMGKSIKSTEGSTESTEGSIKSTGGSTESTEGSIESTEGSIVYGGCCCRCKHLKLTF